jgi:hypothetical protein
LEDGRFSEPEQTELMVKAYVLADEHARGGRPVIQKRWGPKDSADSVGFDLREQLAIVAQHPLVSSYPRGSG